MKAIKFIYLGLILQFFFMLPSKACNLSKKFRYISLSGPVTYTFSELKLLQDKRLEGISIFNPVDRKLFQGSVYGGGVFLAQKKLKAFEDRVVFYDSGRELKKQLTRVKGIRLIEVKTRGKDTLASGKAILNLLHPYLVNCDGLIDTLRQKLLSVEAKLKKGSVDNNKTFLFYLGKITTSKRPNLLMVNDGPVKTLVDYKVIKSYPSELSYVNWSEKLVKKIVGPIHLGLSEGKSSLPIIKRVAPRSYNISYRGILTPGLSQLLFLEYWLKNKFFSSQNFN